MSTYVYVRIILDSNTKQKLFSKTFSIYMPICMLGKCCSMTFNKWKVQPTQQVQQIRRAYFLFLSFSLWTQIYEYVYKQHTSKWTDDTTDTTKWYRKCMSKLLKVFAK